MYHIPSGSEAISMPSRSMSSVVVVFDRLGRLLTALAVKNKGQYVIRNRNKDDYRVILPCSSGLHEQNPMGLSGFCLVQFKT
jgi:hypothetical protein